jgi:hypothetical protein
MAITDEDAVGLAFAGCARVDHGRLSAVAMLNGMIVQNGRSSSRVVTKVGAR